MKSLFQCCYLVGFLFCCWLSWSCSWITASWCSSLIWISILWPRKHKTLNNHYSDAKQCFNKFIESVIKGFCRNVLLVHVFWNNYETLQTGLKLQSEILHTLNIFSSCFLIIWQLHWSFYHKLNSKFITAMLDYNGRNSALLNLGSNYLLWDTRKQIATKCWHGWTINLQNLVNMQKPLKSLHNIFPWTYKLAKGWTGTVAWTKMFIATVHYKTLPLEITSPISNDINRMHNYLKMLIFN